MADAAVRKHTAGPWKLFHKHGVIAILLGGTQREIVQWGGFDASDFQKENLANARLIAAAPELADALESIIKMTLQEAEDKYGDRRYAENFGCVRAAREALEKAGIYD